MHQWLIGDPSAGTELRTAHAFLLLATAVCCWHGRRQLRCLGEIDWRRARWRYVAVAIAPWAGGHVHFMINNWAYVLTHPAAMFLPWMGLHAGGAVIALTLTASLVMRGYHLPLGRIADALVPTIGIGILLGRLGCFAEGCCFGRVCQWPWCVSFPKGTYPYELHLAQRQISPGAMHSAPVHPLQLYFAGVGVVLILLSRWLRPRARYEGQVALLSLVVFSVAAAALEPLRATDDTRVYWGPLPQLQWTALTMAVGSMAMLFAAELRSPSSFPPLRGR